MTRLAFTVRSNEIPAVMPFRYGDVETLKKMYEREARRSRRDVAVFGAAAAVGAAGVAAQLAAGVPHLFWFLVSVVLASFNLGFCLAAADRLRVERRALAYARTHLAIPAPYRVLLTYLDLMRLEVPLRFPVAAVRPDGDG